MLQALLLLFSLIRFSEGDQPGCPEDDRICKQRVDTCSGQQDCGYNEVCCFNPSCGYSCKTKVIPAEFENPEKRRKECPDSLCPPGTIDNCFVNPCDFNTCPNYPDASCCDDFCDCSPRYYDSHGSDVTAMCRDNDGCPPVCAIFCLFGNVYDENGCPTCECKTGCDGNELALAGQSYCPAETCPAGYTCKQPEYFYVDQGVCCPAISITPILSCPMFECPSGYPPCEGKGCQYNTCLGHPDATCCDNPCDCSAMFYDSEGQRLSDEDCGIKRDIQFKYS